MAQPIDPGNYGQFSVIARLRQGTDCSLSTFGIILEIQNHLKPYNCICNVALCSPNFIIHLPTLELQLQILSCKTFTGSDYVLDIVPWSSELTTFQLPWISEAFHQGVKRLNKPQQQNTDGLNILATLATANLLGQSSMECASKNAQADLLCKETTIILDGVKYEQGVDSSIDFSYMMIVELKEFYGAKYKAFQTCEETCREMYGIARAFSNEIERAVKSVYEQTSVYNDAPPEDILSEIAKFGNDLNHPLWFISEEIFDLGMGMRSSCGTNRQPMDLTKFIDPHQNNKFTVPLAATPVLKRIAESAVLQIYTTPLLIATAEDYNETFVTQIWCTSFHHDYKTPNLMTQEEAETSAIYRFLKYITNVLGYSIADNNCDILCEMVSEINYLSISVSEFQLYINKVVSMVHDVQENIKEMHSRIPDQVYENQVPHVNDKINDLLILLQHYADAVEHGLQTFQQHKQNFRSMKFQSTYQPKPDVQ